jgi:glycosyltransferase involved in cell wall biosynthesis
VPPIRVALLHNIVSPHVVPLFERLAQHPEVELKVYFLADTDRNRRWATSVGAAFEHEVLPHFAIRVGRHDLHTFFINPTILSALRRDDFDVLVSAGWDSFASLASFALCKALGKPYVLWSGSTVNEPSWRRTLTLPLVKQVVRRSSAWVAYGSRAKSYLVRLGADAERVSIAYNTVDVDLIRSRASALRPGRERLRHDIGVTHGPVVLYVGQLILRKGVLDLLEAHKQVLSRHQDARLLFVGYGPLEAELRRQVADQQIPGVVFAGHVAVDDMPRFYTAADVFVLPSHEEVWGLVLNEAAACRLPLVTTEATGASVDLVEPGINGWIVPVGQPSRLADAILDAITRANDMGLASEQMIGNKTYSQNVGAILSALRQAQTRRK